MNRNFLKPFLLTSIVAFISALLITNLAIAAPLQTSIQLQSSPQILVSQAAEPTANEGDTQPRSEQPAIKRPQSDPDQTVDQQAPKESTAQKEEPTSAKSEGTQSSGPYDMKAIEEFYKSLYGS